MTDRLSQLQSMIDRDPNDAFCTYALAMEHAKLGQTQQAVRWFDRTLTVDPNQCYAYFHKAKALEASGDGRAAVQTLRAGLAHARACRDLKATGEIEAYLDEIDG